MTKDLHKKYLVEPSKSSELMFIGILFNNLGMYTKYKSLQHTSFTEPMFAFYFRLGRMLWENGTREINDAVIFSFLSSQPKNGEMSLLDYYNKLGGYTPLAEIMEETIDEKNDELYSNNIIKYSILRKLAKQGMLDIKNEKLLKKLSRMTLKQTQSYFKYVVNKEFLSVSNGLVREFNLLDDIDTTIEEMDEGSNLGMELYGSPKLNKHILGWQSGLSFLGLSSGGGKSALSMNIFIMSSIRNREKLVIFAWISTCFWFFLVYPRIHSIISSRFMLVISLDDFSKYLKVRL